MNNTEENSVNGSAGGGKDLVERLLADGAPDELKRFAYCLTGDWNVSDELAQETCITAWQKADQVYSPSGVAR